MTRRTYRALISVPVFATNHDEAYEKAVLYAHSLRHERSKGIAGHLERLVADDGYMVDEGSGGFTPWHWLTRDEAWKTAARAYPCPEDGSMLMPATQERDDKEETCP